MRRRNPLPLLVLAAVLAAAVPSCASPYGNKSAPAAKQPDTYVKIRNDAWLDVNVYVVQGSQRIRLGTVNSNGSARLKLPSGIIFGPTVVSFFVDPIGSNRTARSFDVTVYPGEDVSLTIPPSVR